MKLYGLFVALGVIGGVSCLLCYQCTNCDSPTGLQQCSNLFGFFESCLTIERINGRIDRECGTSFTSFIGCEIDGGEEICYCEGRDRCNDELRGDPPEPEVKCYECKNCDTPSNLVTCKDSFGKPNKCFTQTKSSGDINRGCYAGTQSGCVATSGGRFCYCTEDSCNNIISGGDSGTGDNGASVIKINVLFFVLLGAISTKYLL